MRVGRRLSMGHGGTSLASETREARRRHRRGLSNFNALGRFRNRRRRFGAHRDDAASVDDADRCEFLGFVQPGLWGGRIREELHGHIALQLGRGGRSGGGRRSSGCGL